MSSISQAQPTGASTRRQLLVAAFLGLIAAVLVVVFLNNASDDGPAVAVPGTNVIVAAQPIEAGETITAAMLTVRQLPVAGNGHLDFPLNASNSAQ